ncbi:MAG: SPFH domain-containing protein [Chloroflexota bacterium]
MFFQGFGTYSYQVKDPQQFVTQIVGATGSYRTSEIQERLKNLLVSKLGDVLGETPNIGTKFFDQAAQLGTNIGGFTQNIA